MELMEKRFLVLVGNYGSGKTELALNRAMDFAARGSTTLVDLDIVNPYFRSGEKADMLCDAGIRVLMPTFALSTVDIPALPAEIQSVFELESDHVIFDVGGDDTGAAALGRYAPSFARYRAQTHVALVVNCMRPLTQTPEDVAELAQRIAARGRICIDSLVNNTNLAAETTPEMLREGHRVIAAAAALCGVSQVETCAQAEILAQCPELPNPMPLRRYMAPEWMEDA